MCSQLVYITDDHKDFCHMLGFEVNEIRHYDDEILDFMKETTLHAPKLNKSHAKHLNGRVPCYNGIPSANLFGPAYKKAKFQGHSLRLETKLLLMLLASGTVLFTVL
jgi:hypothetical protein